MIFEPSVIGTLSVRPYTQYNYSWLIAGLHLSAHNEGSLVISAVGESDCQVQDSRTVWLWSQTTDSDVHSDSSDGSVWPPDFQVNFLAEPGRSIWCRSPQPSREISPPTNRYWLFRRGVNLRAVSRLKYRFLWPNFGNK